jgi:hypothetical protein
MSGLIQSIRQSHSGCNETIVVTCAPCAVITRFLSFPDGFVLPVKHALQGHPEAPRLWEKQIVQILDKLRFKSTTHEKCIFQKTVNNEKVLFLRPSRKLCSRMQRRRHIQRDYPTSRGTVTSSPQRSWLDDILQTRDYAKVSCESFLKKVLQQHGWDETIEQHNPIPMRNDTAYQAQIETAIPPSAPKESRTLHDKNFNYQQAIGEGIYAMTVARPDIAYAVIKLSQYSHNPAKIHYQAVRHLFKYLALTKDRGIYYWRKHPVPGLPIVPAAVQK